MKYYSIAFPGEYGQHVEEIWSEKQILDAYYPYWSGMMVQNVAAPDLNPKTCIDDWTVIHWAVEVPKPEWITDATDLMSDKGYELGSLEDAEEFAKKRCYCYNCADPYKRMTTFIVCPTCGNKRCPHATDHNLECTNSNEPNQPGSRY